MEGGTAVEEITLSGLMEPEKASLIAALGQERTPQAAQALLERALDRALMRHQEARSDAASREAAALVVQTLKSALPFMDSVDEARRWTRDGAGDQRRGWKPLTLGLLAAGAALLIAVILALMAAGRRVIGPVALIEALLVAALALGAAFWAGLTAGRPEKKGDDAPTREEFLVDPERVWRHLHGMLLLADDAIERARAGAEAARQAESAADGAIAPGELGLFATLLESAYAMDGPDAREMIEAMRFYLHSAGIEAVDYAPGREGWFEVLPAPRPGTLRPALVSGSRVLKKGLAAK